MVKLFTIVKDEVDIIRAWIVYHGSMFGWNNIYIIDNYSTDGTYEIIKEFEKLNIHIERQPDYRKKGEYMKRLIDVHCKNDIAFPIDIDEFVVLYQNNKINVNKPAILNYINGLNPANLYKANYIVSLITNPNGYKNAAYEAEFGVYRDLKSMAKSFFNTSIYKGEIDHGNHIPTSNYLLTDIHLVHYHYRNTEQIKKKIKNNIEGLGYKNTLEDLKNIIKSNPKCMGYHHVEGQIKVLENTYKLNIFPREKQKNYIDLYPLKNRLIGGSF